MKMFWLTDAGQTPTVVYVIVCKPCKLPNRLISPVEVLLNCKPGVPLNVPPVLPLMVGVGVITDDWQYWYNG
jgi:hypothetical protein